MNTKLFSFFLSISFFFISNLAFSDDNLCFFGDSCGKENKLEKPKEKDSVKLSTEEVEKKLTEKQLKSKEEQLEKKEEEIAKKIELFGEKVKGQVEKEVNQRAEEIKAQEQEAYNEKLQEELDKLLEQKKEIREEREALEEDKRKHQQNQADFEDNKAQFDKYVEDKNDYFRKKEDTFNAYTRQGQDLKEDLRKLRSDNLAGYQERAKERDLAFSHKVTELTKQIAVFTNLKGAEELKPEDVVSLSAKVSELSRLTKDWMNSHDGYVYVQAIATLVLAFKTVQGVTYIFASFVSGKQAKGLKAAAPSKPFVDFTKNAEGKVTSDSDSQNQKSQDTKVASNSDSPKKSNFLRKSWNILRSTVRTLVYFTGTVMVADSFISNIADYPDDFIALSDEQKRSLQDGVNQLDETSNRLKDATRLPKSASQKQNQDLTDVPELDLIDSLD